MRTFLFLISGLFMAFLSCKKAETPPVDDTKILTDVEEISKASQSFGWSIFNEEQRAKPGENVLISPWSIQTALHMALNGAEGKTREQILALFGYDNYSLESVNELQQKLAKLLTEQSGHPTVTIANGFFYDKNRLNVLVPFQNRLENSYQCGFATHDFNQVQPSLAAINGWVETNTQGKIKNILDNITPDNIAFLINALYFKSDWAEGFAVESTQNAPFTTKSGAQVSVPFVSADRNFQFHKGADLSLVDLPFKDSTYSLTLIQRGEQNTDANWHLKLTDATILAQYAQINTERAMVFFPKMKLEFDNNLIPSLKKLGMIDAFDEGSADFSAMGKSPSGANIFISQVRHKAVLEVDEKGAEGAAVTSIGFSVTSVPPILLFDEPYVLILRHIPSNTALFTAFIANPAE